MTYDIISTGSKGNAVVINERILIDCGVPFKVLQKYERTLSTVLLTHIHGDHFKCTTLSRLARSRTTLRFVCGKHLVEPLIRCGIKENNIDVVDSDHRYMYYHVTIEPVDLVHDVPNMGYKLYLPSGEKVFYATDTAHLNGIEAKGFDLYLVEANYVTDEIDKRIDEKKANAEFSYERRAKRYHLSKELADDFIYKNIASNGSYVYLHSHRDEI
ncbi:MAG: MBL fold metallo-hydrolase [Clostridia bacterium]|nr:MBL fold metallo-hydrolase [Clostridia bacterium]